MSHLNAICHGHFCAVPTSKFVLSWFSAPSSRAKASTIAWFCLCLLPKYIYIAWRVLANSVQCTEPTYARIACRPLNSSCSKKFWAQHQFSLIVGFSSYIVRDQILILVQMTLIPRADNNGFVANCASSETQPFQLQGPTPTGVLLAASQKPSSKPLVKLARNPWQKNRQTLRQANLKGRRGQQSSGGAAL